MKNRWISAKKNRLYYRCFGPNHLGNNCHQKGKCNINACEETNNQLLHEEAVVQEAEDKNQPIDQSKPSTKAGETSAEGPLSTTEQFNTTMESQRVIKWHCELYQ